MLKGFDTNAPVTKFAAALKAKGKVFGGRYLRRLAADPTCLTRAEIAALFAQGIALVLVFQHRSNDVAEFTADNARKDAKATLDRLDELGVPRHVTVYLAFDTDFTEANVHVALAYGEIWARAVKGAGYGTGCYGDREVLELLTSTYREGWGDLFDQRWATNAIGWGRPQDYDILQSSLPYTILPNLQVDDCVAHGFTQAGMWRPS